MYTSEELLNSVNKYLSQMQYVREPKSLYEPIKYVLSLGGKRIRPILMMLAYNLFKDDVTWIDGNDTQSIRSALESYDVTKQEQYLKSALPNARRKSYRAL